MTARSRVMLGVRFGFPTENTCPVVVTSLSAGDITISGGFTSVVITPVAVVNGSGVTVGYTGSGTITLPATGFARYSYVATQGARSETGSFNTLPSDTDDFSLFFASCDCNTVFNNPANGGNVTGIWGVVKGYAQNGPLPTAGVFFIDDHGYVDYCKANDAAGTGLAIRNHGAHPSGPFYYGDTGDYVLAYLCNLGMLEDLNDPYINWGRDADRSWCNQNLNYLPQWGDHEFINDMGWDRSTASATIPASGTVSYATIFTSGKAAWDKIMKPLQPAVLNAAHSNGWAASFGCINMIAPDFISNGNGSWDRQTIGAASGEPTTAFGSTQIVDILNYVEANPKPFNVFGMCMSIRYMGPYAWASSGNIVYSLGAQHPLFDHVLPEYQRLFTATGQTPKSLMDNPKSNGVAGVTVLLHGDYHQANVMRHEAPAYSGTPSGACSLATMNFTGAYTDNAAENFWSVCVGTVSGSENFIAPQWWFGDPELNAVPQPPVSRWGTTVEYSSETWATSDGTTDPQLNHQFAGLRIDVYGSKSRPELHVFLLDMDGNTSWSGKWYAKSSNEPVAVTHALPRPAGTSIKASLN